MSVQQPGNQLSGAAGRLSGRQHRAVDHRMSEVLGNYDKPPAVSGWTRFRHDMNVMAQVQHGRPAFPHFIHFVLTVFTSGLWGMVWWAHWMGSARRRYQRERLTQLDAAGMLHAEDLFVPGVKGTEPPWR
ncbi:hypothetical protein GCM10009613_61440 [Pseudonocardia kongjuensis]|uniref:Transmembrane protein n=1 Tax=Pseudonocardia kongjuensis TaxID=102227 RepID=A0ABN1YA09_9PSEU